MCRQCLAVLIRDGIGQGDGCAWASWTCRWCHTGLGFVDVKRVSAPAVEWVALCGSSLGSSVAVDAG